MSDISNSSKSAVVAREDSSTEGSPVFRVATFNTLNGQMHRGRNKHFFKGPVRVGTLVEEVDSFNADIVGLQEVDKRTLRTKFANIAQRVSRKTGMKVSFRPSRRHWVIGLFGNAIATRCEHRDVKVLKLPRLHWREQKRTALLATVNLDGVAVRVVTTHLSSRRDESALQLPAIFAEMGKHDGPAIICGDMNLRTHEAVPFFESNGWTVAESGPTYPSWDPQLRIDYIAVRGIRVVESTEKTCGVSDHCAVLADLQLIRSR